MYCLPSRWIIVDSVRGGSVIASLRFERSVDFARGADSLYICVCAVYDALSLYCSGVKYACSGLFNI